MVEQVFLVSRMKKKMKNHYYIRERKQKNDFRYSKTMIINKEKGTVVIDTPTYPTGPFPSLLFSISANFQTILEYVAN